MQVVIRDTGNQIPATRPAPQPAVAWRIARWPWIFAAVIAVVNSFTIPPLLSGNVGFLLSVVLAIGALAGLPVLTEGMRARRLAVAGGWVVIVLFVASQIGGRVDFGRQREPAGLDFSAYYLAGKALRVPGKPLYYIPTYPDGRMKFVSPVDHRSYWYEMALREGIRNTMPFNYPPFAAVLFEPFTLVRFPAAFAIWTGTTVLLLVGSILLIVLLANPENRLATFIAVVIGVFSFSPVRSTFYFGQINALMLFLWTLGAYLYKKQKPEWSALCFAVGAMIKITPVMVVPLFVLTRRWKWLATFTGWIALLLVMAVAATGWGNLHVYVSRVLPSMSCGAPYFDNRSIGALIQCWYMDWVPLLSEVPSTIAPGVCTVAKIVSLAVYLVMLVMLYRLSRRQDTTDSLVLMALVTLLVSPVTWTHHYVLAVLPLIYLWLMKSGEMSRAMFAATVLATVVVGTNITLYTLAVIRHGGTDLTLAALQPISIALLVMLSSLQGYTISKPAN